MDELFDTRITILSSINEDTAVDVFNKNYNLKFNDTFWLYTL